MSHLNESFDVTDLPKDDDYGYEDDFVPSRFVMSCVVVVSLVS